MTTYSHIQTQQRFQSVSYSTVQINFIFCSLSLSLHVVCQKPESKEQRQNGLKMVDQAIWSKKMSNGVRRTPVSAEQVCVLRKGETERERELLHICNTEIFTIAKCFYSMLMGKRN